MFFFISLSLSSPGKNNGRDIWLLAWPLERFWFAENRGSSGTKIRRKTLEGNTSSCESQLFATELHTDSEFLTASTFLFSPGAKSGSGVKCLALSHFQRLDADDSGGQQGGPVHAEADQHGARDRTGPALRNDVHRNLGQGPASKHRRSF